jgi:hypothetical protein
MQSTIFALVAFGMLLAFVQCTDKVALTEYEIKEGISLVFQNEFY